MSFILMIMGGALMLVYLLAGLLPMLTFLAFLLAIIEIEIYFSISGRALKWALTTSS